MPASSAAWTVAMLSARSDGPYMPDMPIAPRPRAETVGPVLPRVRVSMGGSSFVGDRASVRAAAPASRGRRIQGLVVPGSALAPGPRRSQDGSMDREALAD